jgi:16S rRNA (cytosine967-C5)-methyltransferase
VLDACAAPGGKATAIAGAGARVVAGDVRVNRARLIAANASRLDVDVDTVVADATRPPFAPGTFDAVLIDAPCSGLGALRRRPDARWRIAPRDIPGLAALQRTMLAACAPLVRPGGRLVYSVCTLTAAESVDHPTPTGFEIDSRRPEVGTWRQLRQGWRVLPQDADTDGMVLVRYRRMS